MRLNKFFDNKPPIEGLQEHEDPEANAREADADPLDHYLIESGAVEMSPDAERLLRLAANFATADEADRSLSRTRLFIAAVHESAKTEIGPVELERAVLEGAREKAAFDALAARYSDSAQSFADLPKYVADFLQGAVNLAGIIQPGSVDRLTADGIVAALLIVPDGKFRERLETRQVALESLRDLVLRRIVRRNRETGRRWYRAIGPTVSVASLGDDDPWRSSLEDSLGVTEEAHAFARIAAAKSFDPPLSVGVFGNWGSGKTFFLRLIYEHVESLSLGTAPEAAGDQFHDNIVQIRFNAWHYVETNLWASLVDHIFSELDRWVGQHGTGKADLLFERLSTARELTLDAAEELVKRRLEQAASAARLADAERKLAAAKANAGPSLRAFWTAVRSAFAEDIAETEESLKDAAGRLGLEQIPADALALKLALDSLVDDTRRTKVLATGVYRQLKSWRVVTATAAVCLLVWLSLVVLRSQLDTWLTHIDLTGVSNGMLAISSFVLTLATTLGLIGRRVSNAIKRVERFLTGMNSGIGEQVSRPVEAVKQVQQDFAKLTAEVEEARAILAQSSDRVVDAAREYSASTGRGRLLRFVRDRVSEGQYAKHLGLTATIRRDFEELAACLLDEKASANVESDLRRKAHKTRMKALIDAGKDILKPDEIKRLESSVNDGSAAVVPSFNRIVLYIDDLDRCPPKQVAEVLQAAHLLLGFPIFVVIVAVDARWVSRALERHFPDLLDPGDASAGHDESLATAYDYLEKIFQVPYWVRPMTEAGSRMFIGDRARPVKSEQVVRSRRSVTPAVPPAGPDTPSSPAGPEVPGAAVPPAGPGTPSWPAGTGMPGTADRTAGPNANSATAETVTGNGSGQDRSTGGDGAERAVAKSLVLTPAEIGFMQQIAPYAADSPRRALRFLNIYRIVKTSMTESDLTDLEEGGYRALLTQLAIATAAPDQTAAWLNMLRARVPSAVGDAARSDLRTAMTETEWYRSPRVAQIAKLVAAYLDDRADGEPEDIVARTLPDSEAALLRYAPVAERYSFGRRSPVSHRVRTTFAVRRSRV